MKTMKYSVNISKRVAVVLVTAAAIIVATGLLESGCSRGQAGNADKQQQSGAKSNTSPAEAALDLSPSQLNSIKIEPVGSYLFPVEKEAVGNIDFDEDLSVQVFPPYQGTIIKTFVELGDRVKKDQPLYTIKSPDLIQAESTLIGAAATLELTNKELAARPRSCAEFPSGRRNRRSQINKPLRALSKPRGMQSSSSARREAEIDQMIAARKIDPALVVRSPIPGTDHIQERAARIFGAAGKSAGALLGRRRGD